MVAVSASMNASWRRPNDPTSSTRHVVTARRPIVKTQRVVDGHDVVALEDLDGFSGGDALAVTAHPRAVARTGVGEEEACPSAHHSSAWRRETRATSTSIVGAAADGEPAAVDRHADHDGLPRGRRPDDEVDGRARAR